MKNMVNQLCAVGHYVTVQLEQLRNINYELHKTKQECQQWEQELQEEQQKLE
jgi:hypothetical protein